MNYWINIFYWNIVSWLPTKSINYMVNTYNNTYLAGLAPKTQPKNNKNLNMKNPPEMGFFFIINHLVDYLNLTLNISMHFLNMNHMLKTYFNRYLYW